MVKSSQSSHLIKELQNLIWSGSKRQKLLHSLSRCRDCAEKSDRGCCDRQRVHFISASNEGPLSLSRGSPAKSIHDPAYCGLMFKRSDETHLDEARLRGTISEPLKVEQRLK